jgi:hypothetical protein
MEWLAIIPIVVIVLFLLLIFFIGFTSKGRNSVMKNMMKSNINMLKDMTNGEIGETLKDLSKTTINFRKDILEENKDELKEVAELEADIESGAIKIKAAAAKEGFIGNDKKFCKYCGSCIDSDSKFCMKCGKEQ